jgi:hypothetical protein
MRELASYPTKIVKRIVTVFGHPTQIPILHFLAIFELVIGLLIGILHQNDRLSVELLLCSMK